MNGYWYGSYAGTNSGQLVIALDDMGDHFEGSAYAYDNSAGLPSTFAFIKTPNKANPATITVPLAPIDPNTQEPADWNNIQHLYPAGITVPAHANIIFDWKGSSLDVNWTTNIGTNGSANLPASQASRPSILTPLPIRNWQQFKKYASTALYGRHIFRGQRETLRLRTSFHRSGRADMRRFFLQDDVPTLHRHLSARTAHVFSLTNQLEFAAFLHLAQHHGYPMPLLDWSYSPFVAAFFCYHRIKSSEAAKTSSKRRKVRIFVFDKQRWTGRFPQKLTVAHQRPHVSIIEPIAIENTRLIPQQALSTLTTVDDIETYVSDSEKIANDTYLQAIDLPYSERDLVMRELRIMGITAGSLFPGLDGTCEELKERFFKL